jgi:hypothetical protein
MRPIPAMVAAMMLMALLASSSMRAQTTPLPANVGWAAGGFTRDQMKTAYASILEFLGKQGVMTAEGAAKAAQREIARSE